MAALDVITLDAAKRAINLGEFNADHDPSLESLITAVSQRLDKVIGPVVQRSVTEEHPGGCESIWPLQTPVSEITTVKEWDGTTPTTLTADEFGVAANDDGYAVHQSSYPHDYRISRRSGGSAASFTTGTVELVYVAGRAASTATVDARIAQTAGMILRRLWRREAGSWTQSADFFEATEPTLGTGFFKVFDSVVAEFLGDQLKPPGLA